MNEKPNNSLTLAHWTGIVLLLLLIGGTADDGCSPSAQNSEQKAAPKLVSKSEWLSKVIGQYGQTAQMRVVYQWPVSQFKGLMGEPSSTQTIDTDTFWYYECSDGTIQLSLDTGNLSIGRMAGKINDY